MALQKYSLTQLAGINRKLSPDHLPKQWYVDLLNGILTVQNEIQSIVSRNGLTKVSTGGGTTENISDLEFFGDSIVAHSYKLDTTAPTANHWHMESNSSTLTKLTTGGTPSTFYQSMVQAGNYNILADGKNVYDKTTWAYNAAKSALLPYFAYIKITGLRLVGVDLTGLMYISKIGDYFDYTATNDALQVDLNSVAPNLIYPLGMECFGDYVIIFTMKHIIIWYVPTIFEDIKLMKVIPKGLLSPKAYYKLNSNLFFASTDGLYVLDLNSMTLSESLTEQIKPYWLSNVAALPTPLKNGSGVTYVVNSSPPVDNICHMGYYKAQKVLLISFNKGSIATIDNGGGMFYNKTTWSDNDVLVYSLDMNSIIGRWNLFSGSNYPLSFCEDDKNNLYVGAGTNVYKMNESVYLDDSTPIKFEFKSSYLGSDTEDNYKAPRMLKLMCNLIGIATDTLTYKYNNQPVADMLNDISILTSGSIPLVSGTKLYYNYDLIGRHRMMDFQLTKTSASRIELDDIEIGYIKEGEK